MVSAGDVGEAAVRIAMFAVPLVVGVILHEVAHGLVAYRLGDPTAAQAGRLTLNPLAHVDPVGTVLLPGLLLAAPLLFNTRPIVFGWAKPVPVNFARLRSPRRDAVLVALAGPGTNLVLAALSALALGQLPVHDVGITVAVLRLVALASLTVNVVLAVFNLLPVPPLDGGRILTALLPPALAKTMAGVERLGFLVVMLIAFNTDLVGRLVRPVIDLLLRLAR